MKKYIILCLSASIMAPNQNIENSLPAILPYYVDRFPINKGSILVPLKPRNKRVIFNDSNSEKNPTLPATTLPSINLMYVDNTKLKNINDFSTYIKTSCEKFNTDGMFSLKQTTMTSYFAPMVVIYILSKKAHSKMNSIDFIVYYLDIHTVLFFGKYNKNRVVDIAYLKDNSRHEELAKALGNLYIKNFLQ